MNILLLGGNGFLGQGLKAELDKRKINNFTLDKNDIDFTKPECVIQLVNKLQFVTHIVILASNIGSILFNSDDETVLNAANENEAILENIKNAIYYAYEKYKKQYNVILYSTSEVYGNRKSKYDIIKNITNYNIDKSKGLRYLYAYIKATYEQKFNDLLNLYNSPLFSFKVIRPFNIIGQNQKRGVLFEMIKSAVLNKKIKYNKDTTRTFTGIDYASSKAVDVIISSGSYSVNVSDTRCSITLEQLANIVKNVLNIDCQLIETEPDKYIQFRQTSYLNENTKDVENILAKYIKDIFKVNNNIWQI